MDNCCSVATNGTVEGTIGGVSGQARENRREACHSGKQTRVTPIVARGGAGSETCSKRQTKEKAGLTSDLKGHHSHWAQSWRWEMEGAEPHSERQASRHLH